MLLGLKIENFINNSKVNFAFWKAGMRRKFSFKRLPPAFNPEVHPRLKEFDLIHFERNIWMVWGLSKTGSGVYHLVRIDPEYPDAKIEVLSKVLLKSECVLAPKEAMSLKDYQELISSKHDSKKKQLLET